MIAAPDGLGSSIANLNGGGALPTSIALVWIKNTGNQLMWVYYCAADQMTVEPLASSATDYFALGVGKSALIYVRVLQQYLFHNAAFAGFLGLSGGWSGLAADPASTADIVVLGLDSYWSSVDYT
jgi:hypothetical protein